MTKKRRSIIATAFVMTILLTPLRVFGQESNVVVSTDIFIFRDGVIQIRQVLSVNETLVSVSLPLLAQSVSNVLALDQQGLPLTYELTLSNITVITLGATVIDLEYTTSDLTSKNGKVWTLKIHIQFEATITLPEHSEIIYLNELPTSIISQENKTVLTIEEGLWEISYILPYTLPTPSPTPTPTPLPPPLVNPDQTIIILLTSTIGIAIIVGFLLIRRRRIESNISELRPEDREVLQYLSDRGGRVLESELRKKFLLPKTSVWRLVRRLERMGYVQIRKEGMQNVIEFVHKN